MDGEPVAEPLLALLGSCVVRIDRGGEFSGTGFFVAPGEVLTCAHVVHGGESITVTTADGHFTEAEVVSPVLAPDDPAAKFYPLPDTALLRLAHPPSDHPCVEFDRTTPVTGPPDVFRLDAFTQDEHAPGQGVHTGATAEFESSLTEDGCRLYKLRGGQVAAGFSGGPLLSRRTGGVCAVVDSSRDQRSDLGGFGVAIAEVLAALPGLRARNDAFHAADPTRRWTRAREEEALLVKQRAGQEPELRLLAAVEELDWRAEDPPSELLRPRYGVVPYVGRGDLLGHLMRWRESEDSLRVLVLLGDGGFGKTRTAMEICVAAERAGWTTGLLGTSDEAMARVDAVAAWPARLLVVVDYAETRPHQVADLLGRLHRQRRRMPARIVLVVRQVSTKDALVDLFAQGDAHVEVGRLIRRAELVAMTGRDWELDRHALFDAAVTAFAARLQRPRGAVSVDLRAERFARPLFVLAAALLAVSTPGLDVAALSEDELLGQILQDHEKRYWQQWNDRRGLGLAPEDQQCAVALVALLGAGSESDEDTERVIRLLPGFADASGERVVAVARWLAGLYHPTTTVTPLEPDLLAETLVARTLADTPDLLGRALDVAAPTQLARCLLVASRMASRREEVRGIVRQALNERLPILVSRLPTLDDGSELIAALRLAVAELHPVVGAIAAAHQVIARDVESAGLAIELYALATTGWRILAEKNPEQYHPALAAALNNQSTLFSGVGRPGAGLEPIAEAVHLYRGLAETDPDRFLPNLAGSLNTQSTLFSEVGRPGAGLEPIAEAVHLYRGLAETDPDRFLPDFAMSLNNQSIRFSGVGRPGAGLDPIAEAVRIRRGLAETDPDRFLPDLAMSLNNQANLFSGVGRPGAGLDPIAEAVRIRRGLAETDPDRFLPDLAGSLNNQANLFSGVGRPGAGLDPIAEAVHLYRGLAEADPERFLPDLAQSLRNQADRFSETGRRDDVDPLFSEVLAEFTENTWARGVLLLTRAHWRHATDEPTIADCLAAITHLRQAGDHARLGNTRALLRRLRVEDTEAFDHAWPRLTDAAQPLWLRLPESDPRLTKQITDWVTTPDWDESFSYLATHADTLLTDAAEAAVEHLIDANPHHTDLHTHRQILANARSDGIDTTREQFFTALVTQKLVSLLERWIATGTVDESRAFLIEHAEHLLTDHAETILTARLDTEPDDAVLLAHLGLLGLARQLGPEAAYDEHTVIPDTATAQLAAARLRAGRDPTNGQASFEHALAALLTGLPQEATRAMNRCQQHTPTWKLPDLHRQLDNLAAQHPDLDLTALRHELSPPPETPEQAEEA